MSWGNILFNKGSLRLIIQSNGRVLVYTREILTNMKRVTVILFIIIGGCNNNQQQKEVVDKNDSISIEKKQSDLDIEIDTVKLPPASQVYSNARFRNVTVEKTGDHTFLVKGQGQIFEASFNWVVEDGHEELKKGYEITDAGAPEWGNFKFSVDAPKKRPNSTLHIILFETSAKDGSRQHELPVLLY